jgi:hypothetical protein
MPISDSDFKKDIFPGSSFFQFNDIHKQRILCKLLLKTASVRFLLLPYVLVGIELF